MRRILTLLLVAIAVIGALVLVIVVTLQTSWARGQVRELAERRAGAALDATVSIGGLRGSLLFGVVLDDVTIARDGRVLVTVEQVAADYDPWQLAGGRLQFDRIALRAPAVFADALTAFAGLGGGRRTGAARPIAFDEIVVSNGRVTVGAEPAELGGVRVPDVIRDVDATLGLTIAGGRTTIALEHLSFTGRDPALVVRDASGTVVLADGDVALNDLRVQLGQSAIELDGTIRRAGQRAGESPSGDRRQAARDVDITIRRAELSFSELRRLVPALDGLTLPADFRVERLEASGPLTSMRVEFALQSGDGRISGSTTADVIGRRRGARGAVHLDGVNLARLLQRPAMPSSITGTATYDLTLDTSGGTPAFDGAYALDVARVDVAGYTAQAVDVEGRVSGQALHIDRARASAYGAVATAAGRVGLPLGGQPVTYALTGRATAVDLGRLPGRLDVPDLETDLDLTFQLDDMGAGLTGSVRFERSEVAGGVVDAGTRATFDATGDRIAYTAAGRITAIDPRRIARALDIEALSTDRFAGEITGSFAIEGRGSDVLPAQVTLAGAKLFGGRIPELHATVRRTAEKLAFTTAGTFVDLRPAVMAQRDALDGEVTGSLDLRGSIAMPGGPFDWSDLSIGGAVTLDASNVEGITVDQLVVSGQLDEATLRLERFELDGPSLAASAMGALVLDGRAVGSDLTYFVNSPGLSAFSDVIGEPIEGQVRLQGRVTGGAPLRIVGSLAGADAGYGDVEATTVNATYDVVLPPAQPAAAVVDATVDAAFVRVAGRTLTEVVVGGHYEERTARFDARLQEADRTIRASGRADIAPARQRVEVETLEFTAPQMTWQLPPSRAVVVDYGDGRLSIDHLRLEGPGGQVIVADGALGPRPDDALDVRIERLALGTIDTLVLGEDGLGGTLNADAEIGGSVGRPRLLDAQVVIEDGLVRDFRFERLDAGIGRTADGYRFDARLQQSPSAILTAGGTLPASLLNAEAGGDDAGVIDATVAGGPIDLGFAGAFSDAVTAVGGSLDVKLAVTGTLEAPRFDGYATIRDGTFGAPALGTTFSGMTATMQFEPDVMAVSDFRVLDENGNPLSASGRLPYSSGRIGDVTIDVVSDGFELVDNEYGDVEVSTDLTITGTLLRPRIEGLIRVPTGELRVDRILDLRQGDLYRAVPLEGDVEVEADDEPSGLLRDLPVSLAVRLEIPSLELTGSDLRGPAAVPVGLGDVNIVVEGDLRLEKGREEPLRITGDVATVRGTYEFQGRRFEIVRGGTVRFPGLVEIDPLLDVTAQRVISGVETLVGIGGTLRRPELTLASRPPLDEADILSLIVFNQPASQLGAVEQVSLGRRAAALASSFVASRLAESLGGVFDLDIFEIDTGTDTDALSPAITVGEQFGEDFFLKVQQTFGGGTQLALEYEITDWLRLQTTASDERDEAQSLFRRVDRNALRLIFFFSY